MLGFKKIVNYAHLFVRGVKYLKRYGVRQFIRRLTQLSEQGSISAQVKKNYIFDVYSFIDLAPYGNPADAERESTRTINWFIPPFGFGSGGHLNIFRYVNYLEQAGFECRIIIAGDCQEVSLKTLHTNICEWFFPIQASVYLCDENTPPAFISIATSWQTAYYVKKFRASRLYYYFVQDYEPFFYARGSEYAWAEETYRFGFKGITAGKWLADKLASEYQMETVSFGFSYDKALYKPIPKRQPATQRLFFYARPVTSRRAFELGILALQKVYEQRPETEFVLAGWDTSSYVIPFPHLNAGVVPLAQLPDLYSQCDVALVLSLTNVSLLPLELMACNCAVVSNRGSNVEWLLDEQVVKYSEPTVSALSLSITELFDDEEELTRLRNRGQMFAETTSWEAEVAVVSDVFLQDVAGL